ncbi:MAG TPA: serine/threonine-protein kinase [Polyangia bacterium]|nr:serine/threonine-protein kinase [Polyangia bacterium]
MEDCLDEDAVLGFVDGRLDAAGRGSVENHIATCPACSDLVATAAGGVPEPPAGRLREGETAGADGLAPGATVGRYVILNLVGRGGMGEVYAAYDPQLDRKVALKLLHETAAREAAARTARERLLREAKAIARLSHPNVVVVHDAGAIDDPVHGDRVFLAMEFIEGETVAAWVAERPRAWREIRDVFAAAGEGLAAAHEAGLVHRDFKPQNVMVAGDGSVRVMDFGLASDCSVMESDTPPVDFETAGAVPTSHMVALTATGVLLGTPLYMAPEQFLARATDARTDQFSFCVALYEALYGERPFPSPSFPSLLEAVVGGHVREPAQRARVPSFLRRLLLRGLETDPAARYPSMRALLEALGHDPLRRRRTFLTAAAVAVGAVAAAAGMQRMATRGQRMCGGASEKLAGIWAPGDHGERREAIHRAFLGTGRAFAEETWIHVSRLLDDYSRRWTGMYVDACEATHVRGDQSAEVLDLRMTCLEGPRAAMKALTDVLSRIDPAVLVQAVDAAQALPPLERCTDVPALRTVVPPPADAETRGRVAVLRGRLAEVKALTDTGQWPAADRKAGPLVDAARAVGYEPLLAEALAAKAWLESETGQPAVAAKTFEAEVWAALAARRDDLAAEAASQEVAMDGYFLARHEEAERWEKLAEALQRRLGPGHDRIAAWLYQDRANLRAREGNNRAALTDFERALSLKQKVLPPNHPDIAISLLSIASAQNELGNHEAALVAANRAVEIYQDAYGKESPQVGHPLGNRGESYELLGRYPEAERDLRKAVDLSAQWVGADHPWTAYPLTELGKTLFLEHRVREALPILERALRIREKSEPNVELVAETRFALARARWEVGQDRTGALTLAGAARDTYRKMPAEAKHAAEIEAWMAGKSATSGN